MREAAMGLLALLGTGCLGDEDANAHIPGEELGQYRVAATVENSTCGSNALGVPDQWEFDVRLSRDDVYLYWLNGQEVIPGQLAEDGSSFEFHSRIEVQVSESGGARLGCTVKRADHSAGQLEGSDLDVPGFAGTLTYSYSADETSDCSSLVGVTGGFAALPCEMQYAIEAVRTALPDEQN